MHICLVEADPLKKTLEVRLERFPELRTRFEAMLDIMENTDGSLVKADDAEERVLEELQKTGNQALTGWAKTQEAKLSQQMSQQETITRNGKKT